MDIFTTEKRSQIMGLIKGKNTKPEIKFRKSLFAKGYRYKIHDKKLPGTPDIVLPKYKTVIFINGCFWHGHCCQKRDVKTNTKFWCNKILRNKDRDSEKCNILKQLGWHIYVIWECEIKNQKLLNDKVHIIDMELKNIGRENI